MRKDFYAKFYAGAKDFYPNFLQTCPEILRATPCVSISSHSIIFGTKSRKTSSCDSPHVGCRFFKIKQHWASFLFVFSGSLPRISGVLQLIL